MPVLWVIRTVVFLLRNGAPPVARAMFRYWAADYLSSLVMDATRSYEDQEVYRDTLQKSRSYPSFFRRAFFEIVKSTAQQVAWDALVAFGRRLLESDPSMEETVSDLLDIDAAVE